MRLTGWRVGTFLIFLTAIKASLGQTFLRQKRQLFREDIPHHRPLDGAYDQRPQGENSGTTNELGDGNLNNNNNNIGQTFTSIGGPLRFQKHNAIKVQPYRYKNNNNNVGGISHHQHKFPPKPNFDNYNNNLPPPPHKFSDFAPALLQFHQGAATTKVVGVKGHSRNPPTLQHQLNNLWHQNYHRNVPSPDNRPVFSYAFREDY